VLLGQGLRFGYQWSNRRRRLGGPRPAIPRSGSDHRAERAPSLRLNHRRRCRSPRPRRTVLGFVRGRGPGWRAWSRRKVVGASGYPNLSTGVSWPRRSDWNSESDRWCRQEAAPTSPVTRLERERSRAQIPSWSVRCAGVSAEGNRRKRGTPPQLRQPSGLGKLCAPWVQQSDAELVRLHPRLLRAFDTQVHEARV
jgi:hypothetical protein